MKIAVRYHTRTGNTKRLAEAAAQAAGVTAESVSEPLAEKAEILLLGSSVYGGKPDAEVISFINANADKIGKIVVFGSTALKRSTLGKIKEEAAKHKIAVHDEEFSCPGSFIFLHKNRPDAEDCEKLKAFVKGLL